MTSILATLSVLAALVFAVMVIVATIEVLAVLRHPGSDRERRPT
jgi:hypothetical protein